MGCGYRREQGQGKKAEVARGGWAEDVRRPPATSLVSASIRLLGRNWGRVGAFETSGARYVQSEGAPARRLGHGFEEFGRFDAQRVCQRNDVYDRNIPFAPLDPSNVVAM